MRLSGKLLAAAAATVLVSSSAMAADAVIIPPAAPPAPLPVEDPAFTGPYWGAYGGMFCRLGRGGCANGPMVGTQFGYNLAANNLRFGLEVETEYYRVNPTWVDATLNGRVGFVLGTHVLIYGQAGIGTWVNLPLWSAGGGVELALGTNLALFVEGKALFLLGGGPGIDVWSIRGGVNYYADENNLDATGAFDWGGLYFGANGGVISGGGSVMAHGGVQVGYNLGGGPFVGGVEVETSHSFMQIIQINAALSARAGVAFGNLLIYGEAGIASLLAIPLWTAGGGVELALGSRLSMFGEGKAVFMIGGSAVNFQVNAGVNVHFGH